MTGGRPTIGCGRARRWRRAATASWVLLASLAACSRPGPARVLDTTTGGTLALNQPLVVRLDGPLDPLSVTPRSVSVMRADGRALAARVDVADGAIQVWLEVDAELLSDPPAAAIISLTGEPSLHALATRDGRRLGAGVRRQFALEGGLHADGSGPPRLVSPSGATTPESAPLTLVFAGPLDPATVTPDCCPALPVAEGLALEPVPASISWRCVGQRFEGRLDWARPHGELRLDLRRCSLRGLHGGMPDPAPRSTVAPASAR